MDGSEAQERKIMIWSIYLSGEIHTDWREQIIDASKALTLPVEFYSPVTDHAASDDAAQNILGDEPTPFWKDHRSAQINAIRTKTYIEQADLVVVRFGDKYKQWNAAFDAGYAAALGKPYIVLHDEALIHPLKEVDAAALAVAKEPEEVVKIFEYVMLQK